MDRVASAALPGGARVCDWRAALGRSALQPVAGAENPDHPAQTEYEEHQGHGKAHAYAHIGGAIEAPAKAVYQVNDRVEQTHRAPDRRQNVDRVEGSAEE